MKTRRRGGEARTPPKLPGHIPRIPGQLPVRNLTKPKKRYTWKHWAMGISGVALIVAGIYWKYPRATPEQVAETVETVGGEPAKATLEQNPTEVLKKAALVNPIVAEEQSVVNDKLVKTNNQLEHVLSQSLINRRPTLKHDIKISYKNIQRETNLEAKKRQETQAILKKLAEDQRIEQKLRADLEAKQVVKFEPAIAKIAVKLNGGLYRILNKYGEYGGYPAYNTDDGELMVRRDHDGFWHIYENGKDVRTSWTNRKVNSPTGLGFMKNDGSKDMTTYVTDDLHRAEVLNLKLKQLKKT